MKFTMCRSIDIVILISCLTVASALQSAPPVSPPTFVRDIALIIHKNCSSCHRPDAVGPFSLLSYADVKKRGRQIEILTGRRFMPPWLPVDGFGDFIGERRLKEHEIELLRQWVAANMPVGESSAEQNQPPFDTQWLLGEPDMVLTMNELFTIPAEGNTILRTFVLPFDSDGDRYVRAIKVKPSNPRVVLNAAFFIDTTGQARRVDAATPQPGYPATGGIGLEAAGSFGEWSPVMSHLALPYGMARRLPAGADLCVEMHFKPTGKVEQEQTTFELYFSYAPVKHEVLAITMGSLCLDIAPGEARYQIEDEFVIPTDVHLVGLAPLAHYICRRISITAELPDESILPLLQIDEWDFNFKQFYQYRQPVCLPAGSRIHMQYQYDNSQSNLRNPYDPPQRISLGHEAAGELAWLILHITPDDPQDMKIFEKMNLSEHQKRIRIRNDWRNSQEPATEKDASTISDEKK